MEECQTAFEELCMYLAIAILLTSLVEKEMLYLYLASSVMVSSILIQEVEDMQKPVYYTNKLLKDVETRYPRIEKTTNSLLISSRWLWPLFKVHSITVLIDYPL